MSHRNPRLLRAFCAAAVLSIGLAQNANSADANGKYALEGPGRLSCADFNAFSADNRSEIRILAGWVTGYLSAHNRLVGETYDLTPWQNVQTLMSLARQYCQAKPEARFEASILEVMKWAAPTRATEESPLITIGTGDKTVILYQSTLQQARQALSDASFDPGSSDTDLERAVRDYQQRENIPTSGLLDQATLARLLGN